MSCQCEACRCNALTDALALIIAASDEKAAADRAYERAVISARGLLTLEPSNREVDADA
jgi:hypothetical protein